MMEEYRQYKEYIDMENKKFKENVFYLNTGISNAKMLSNNVIDEYISLLENNKEIQSVLISLQSKINESIDKLVVDENFVSDKKESELDKALKQDYSITRIDVTKIYDKNSKRAFIFQNSYKNNINVESIGYELDLDKSQVSMINSKELESLKKYYDNSKDNVLIANKSFKDIDIAKYFVDEIINNIQKENDIEL